MSEKNVWKTEGVTNGETGNGDSRKLACNVTEND